MNKEEAIKFAGLMEEYLNIPSFMCEYIENELIKGNYKEVIEYVIKRRNEYENNENFVSNQDMHEYIMYWQEQNDIKQQRIDKAIEYIKTTNFWGLYEDTPMIDVKYGEDLLEILKGDNNGEIRYWGDNNEK